MMCLRSVGTCAVLVMLGSAARGQLATFNFTNQSGNATTSVSPTLAPGVTSTAISRGNGLTSGANTSYTFSSTQFTAHGTLANAVANNDYPSFTVTASPGQTFQFKTLFLGIGRSNAGPRRLALESSVTRFGSNTGNVIDQIAVPTSTAATSSANGLTFDLSALNPLIKNTSGTVLEFRLYGYRAQNTAGSFSLMQLDGNATNAITLDGQLVPVPEPGLIGVTGTVVLGIGSVVRRNWRKRVNGM